tara:strand:- start:2151 stop:2552 length:402 start_codon:yes stop_codon:yes gene_type:complete
MGLRSGLLTPGAAAAVGVNVFVGDRQNLAALPDPATVGVVLWHTRFSDNDSLHKIGLVWNWITTAGGRIVAPSVLKVPIRKRLVVAWRLEFAHGARRCSGVRGVACASGGDSLRREAEKDGDEGENWQVFRHN